MHLLHVDNDSKVPFMFNVCDYKEGGEDDDDAALPPGASPECHRRA